MKNYKILLACLAMSSLCYGQTDSLKAYLETSARNNPSVQQRWSEYQAALQKVPQVGSLPDPELNLGFFLKPMELLGGNQVADLQLMQMFPWFGVLKNAKDEMSLMANASLASVQEMKLQVFYEVRSTWYALYQNREQLRIMEQNLTLLRQLERLATSRYRSGASSGTIPSNNAATGTPVKTESSGSGMSGMSGSAGAPTPASAPMATTAMASTGTGGGLSEIYALQLQVQELLNSIETLNDAFRNLQFKFNTLLNRSVESSIELPAAPFIDDFQPPSDSALKNNPMLEMIRFEQESLEARKKMSERMGYPMVGIGLKYSVLSKNPASTSMMNGQDMLMPMVSVTLPVYRKKYKAIQKEVEWRKTASEQSYQAMLNLMQTDYQDALLNYRDAQRRILLYERQRLLAEKSYQLQLKRFGASSGSLSDVQNLSRQLLDYSLNSLNASVDLLRAQAKIRQLTATE